jgi:hypothetical protein
MDLKGTLRAITLELRRELEGKYDVQGNWQPGDLERQLASIGVRRDRAPVPVEALTLSADDREARRVVEAFLQSRAEAGDGRETAVADFVREAAYSWANRLFALRCMEARGLIDEVILQKAAYGGRSLQHTRLAKRQPERCAGEDGGLFATLFDEFSRRSKELPLLFDPKATEVALRPSVAALKRCIALLSGTLAAKGQEVATDEVFTAPDALGWTYQYWNTEEKSRVFEKVRTKKGSKIEGAEIIPATCIYTEPYMVKFLVQNSLGATWMGMNPGSLLCEGWEYYVRGADRASGSKKLVSEITFLDPACGSGHFLTEAFAIEWFLMHPNYTEGKFIATFAALEHLLSVHNAEIAATIFGRVDFSERILPDLRKAFDSTVKSLPGVSDAALKIFRSKLDNLNSRPLAGRLTALLDYLRVPTRDITDRIPGALRARNSLLHRGQYIDGIPLDDHLTILREVVLRAILTLIGFSGSYECYLRSPTWGPFPPPEGLLVAPSEVLKNQSGEVM